MADGLRQYLKYSGMPAILTILLQDYRAYIVSDTLKFDMILAMCTGIE